MTGHAILREAIRLARDGLGFEDLVVRLGIDTKTARSIVWAVNEQMALERQRKAS